MPGLEFRYVGQDRLAAQLSEFDVERYFALTDSDVAAVNERFRRDRRAGVAIQLIFLRASGHTLDHVGTLPRRCCAMSASGSACPPRRSPRSVRFINATRHCTSIRSGPANILA